MRKHSKIMTEACEKWSTMSAEGHKLNSEKIQFKQNQVSYMATSCHRRFSGLKVINEMPPPTDKEGVQRVLGMIHYVQKFALNLADLAKSPR